MPSGKVARLRAVPTRLLNCAQCEAMKFEAAHAKLGPNCTPTPANKPCRFRLVFLRHGYGFLRPLGFYWLSGGKKMVVVPAGRSSSASTTYCRIRLMAIQVPARLALYLARTIKARAPHEIHDRISSFVSMYSTESLEYIRGPKKKGLPQIRLWYDRYIIMFVHC